MSLLSKAFKKFFYVEFRMVGWDEGTKNLEYIPVRIARVRYYYAMGMIQLKVLLFRIKQVFKKG